MVEGLTKIKGYEEVISKSTEIASKIEFYRTAQGLAKSQIDTIDMVVGDLEKQIYNISQVSSQLSSNKKIKSMLEMSIEKIDDQCENLNYNIKVHEVTDINKARKDKKEIEDIQKEIDVIEEEIRKVAIRQSEINSHMSNRPSVVDYTKEIEEINARLIVLMKETGKCPAGDKCPFLLPVKGQIEYLTEQIEDRANRSIVEQDAYEKWEKAGKLLPQVDASEKLYAQLKEKKNKIQDTRYLDVFISKYEEFALKLDDYKKQIVNYRTESEQITTELAALNKDIKEIEIKLEKFNSNKVNSDLASLRISKQDLQKQLDLATLNVSLAANAQYAIKDAQEGILALQNGLVESRGQAESLELLKEALSPRGIKAVVIDYIVPQLEERINGILSKMSDFRIRLDTQKATVDEEGVKEGLFITVLNDLNEELPFSSFSGGEKVKITVAISEALASLMSGVGFRIMDENIVSLDKESTEGFVSILTKLQNSFPQLLIISHLQEVKDIFEKSITVTKVNGISQIYAK